ncbi:MAG: nucleotide sugar dehydrogenase [Acidocella sp.]|nr:nucleotide sugar dehydrogenase [Acidocella sp.]
MARSAQFDAVVIGCGTIGAAVGVALASAGWAVALYDADPRRRATLREGGGFHEAALAGAISEAMTTGHLQVVDQLVRQPGAAKFIICTPTPVAADGGFDRAPLERVTDDIAAVAQDGDAVLVRSTVPVGTTRALAERLRGRGRNLHFAAVPDRSVEGRSFADQFSVPHLIGGVDAGSAMSAKTLLTRLGPVVDLGVAEAAEAAKLFANGWRAALFALSNAMASVCETHGLDVREIFAGAAKNYPRFAPPRPGPVAGPCLPKDLQLLAASVPGEAGVLLRGVMMSESQIMLRITDTLATHLAGRPGAKIALLGIAFKGQPEVDDARGGVALALAARLQAAMPGAELVGWDAAMPPGQTAKLGIKPAETLWAAAAAADIVVLCNDHPVFAQTDAARLAHSMAAGGLIYDVAGGAAQWPHELPNNVTLRVFGRGVAHHAE